MDITNWIGDWMYDEKKLDALTEERAHEDIFIMSKSPDYTDFDVNTGIDMAAKQLKIDRLYFVAELLIENANQMSKM